VRWYRIWGITLRYLYNFRHSIDRLSDAFYWPTVDLVLWGLTSQFFVSRFGNESSLLLALLAGIIFWIIVWRGQYKITVNFLEELWNRNLVNIFVSPLKFSEWVVSLLLIGVVKAGISFTFATFVAYLLYRSNVWLLGWYILPYSLILIMFGWAVGLLVTGIMIRYGTKIQTLAWTAIYLVAPFSAVYYPLATLPEWARTVSLWVPTSYVFEAVRGIVLTGDPTLEFFPRALALSTLYLVLSVVYMKVSYQAILRRGLIGLE